MGYGGLSAGIYQVYLKYRDVKSNEYTLRVVETFDYDKAPKLMLGSNNIADESGKWYAFEPDVSGIYADKFDKTQIKPTWYYAYEGDDSWSKLSDGYWLHGNEHQLEAGVRYLVYLKKNSIVVFIDRPVENILGDIQVEKRPLLANGKEVLYKLYDERYDLYKKYCDYRVENTGSLDEIVDKIAKLRNS